MNLTKYGNLQNGGDGYSFDVSHNIAGNPQVNSYTQCSRVGGNSPLEQPPVPIKQESVVPQIGGDAYSFDYSKPKIGNLPEVTRIEQCGDHVKQDAPFMGMVGGDAYSFDYSKPKIGNLPEVTRIEQCGDHVKQDAPFMGMVGGNPYVTDNKYNYIINANTGKKMSVFGKEGKQYLKKLIKMYQRGSMARMPPPQTMLEDE